MVTAENVFIGKREAMDILIGFLEWASKDSVVTAQLTLVTKVEQFIWPREVQHLLTNHAIGKQLYEGLSLLHSIRQKNTET